MRIFDTRYLTSNEYKRHETRFKRQAAPWDCAEDRDLTVRFNGGYGLINLCSAHERSPGTVLYRLEKLGLITRVLFGPEEGKFGVVEDEATNESEKDMNTGTLTTAPATIETRTYIEGCNAAEMSDEHIYAIIERKENEMRKWDGLNNKPKKIATMRAKLQDEIAALVNFVDSRE